MTEASANLAKLLGPKVALIGMGKSGIAARDLLNFALPEVKLFTFDDKSPDADSSDPKAVENFNPSSLIVSPGFPLSTPWLKGLLIKGVPCLNEVDLASFFLKDERVIGITGSLGKSTTAALIYEAAKELDEDAFIGANFGTPLSEYALHVQKHQRPRALWIIAELSSYHLETLRILNLDLGIVTYLAANHLERYENIQQYYDTKLKIFARTTGKVLLNMHSEDLAKAEIKFPNAVTVHLDSHENLAMAGKNAKLLGQHNQQNILLALKTVEVLHWGGFRKNIKI
ncbi:MAG: Mur ligase family protein [Bdellovibrionota bacterium]